MSSQPIRKVFDELSANQEETGMVTWLRVELRGNDPLWLLDGEIAADSRVNGETKTEESNKKVVETALNLTDETPLEIEPVQV